MPRNTRQREAIRSAFHNASRPLNPNEVLDVASQDVEGMGIATVYRNLKRLLKEGFLNLVEVPGRPAYYELANLAHHHHFECRRCGRIFDVEGCPGNLRNMLADGWTLEDHEILMRGLCEHCGSE